MGTDTQSAATGPHDPGTELARARADRLETTETLVRVPAGGIIRFGTAGWTDKTLTAAGVFYPPSARSPEDRLRYYASRFPLVEVDATYYALPTAPMAALWAERTPDDFVFDIKANALMTGHSTDVARLPPEIREALPPTLAAQRRVKASELPPEIDDAVWGSFAAALEPLRRAGKLGGVLMQFPPWIGPTREGASRVLTAVRRLASLGLQGTVELRNADWFAGEMAPRTLRWLERHDIPYVMVDEPQGRHNSVPPVTAVTSPALAVFRFHGRRAETWARPNVGVAERFRYLYDSAELAPWAEPIVAAAQTAREVHVVFNNCYGNYGTTNALEMAALVSRRS